MTDRTPETTHAQTVGELMALLATFDPKRSVVFIDPDTEWRADIIIRDPKEWELRDGESRKPPLIVTGNPYDQD